MFFVFGISSKEKETDFHQTIICPNCGSYGRLDGFITYSFFSLFFIPILKWNKKYYFTSSCCETVFTLDNEIGKEIENGRLNKLDEADLIIVNRNINKIRYCSKCNYPIEVEFEYCPKCGEKIE